MKTTKADREWFRWALNDGRSIAGKGFVKYVDDIDDLESRCAWQAEKIELLEGFVSEMQTKLCWQESMLERAKGFDPILVKCETQKVFEAWLADLEEGPQ